SCVLLWLAIPAIAAAQPGTAARAATAPPATRVSMAQAVRLALDHNHQLQGQRLAVDMSRADQITPALKANPVLTSVNADFPVFSPSQLTWNNLTTNQTFVESLSYLFERGGKRQKRTQVAQDTTAVAAQTAADAERQLTFETQQAFINVLL